MHTHDNVCQTYKLTYLGMQMHICTSEVGNLKVHMQETYCILNLYVCACMLSCFSHVQLFAALWTVVHQTPLSMEFSRQEYWSRLPYSPPGDLRGPGIVPASLMTPALAGDFFTTSATWEALNLYVPIRKTFKCRSFGVKLCAYGELFAKTI